MSHIRVERTEDGVGWLTIDRPQRLNSLDVETARDLRKAGLELCRDTAVRCVVLQGVNGVFCSGADLKYIRAGGEAADLGYLQPKTREIAAGHGERFKQILEYLHATISELKRAPKPVVAAVDGVAAAGGFGLAMACDIVLASARSRFEWAYGKTALTGAESSTFFLPRLVGLRRAFDLAFLNPRLDAAKAKEIGLVSEVIAEAEWDAEVRRIAAQLAAGPTRSYAVTKMLLHAADGVDRLDVHLDRELEELARAADGELVAEGITAFFEKRPPKFPHA